MGMKLDEIRKDALSKVRGIKEYSEDEKNRMFNVYVSLEYINEEWMSRGIMGYNSAVTVARKEFRLPDYLESFLKIGSKIYDRENLEDSLSAAYFIEDPQGLGAIEAFVLIKGIILILDKEKHYSTLNMMPYIPQKYCEECMSRIHNALGKKRLIDETSIRQGMLVDIVDAECRNAEAMSAATMLGGILVNLKKEEINILMKEIWDLDMALPMMLMDRNTRNYIFDMLTEERVHRMKVMMTRRLFYIRDNSEGEKDTKKRVRWLFDGESGVGKHVEKVIFKLAVLKAYEQIAGDDIILENVSQSIKKYGDEFSMEIVHGLVSGSETNETPRKKKKTSESMSLDEKIESIKRKIKIGQYGALGGEC